MKLPTWTELEADQMKAQFWDLGLYIIQDDRTLYVVVVCCGEFKSPAWLSVRDEWTCQECRNPIKHQPRLMGLSNNFLLNARSRASDIAEWLHKWTGDFHTVKLTFP